MQAVPLGEEATQWSWASPRYEPHFFLQSNTISPTKNNSYSHLSDTRVSDFHSSCFSDWKIDKSICLNMQFYIIYQIMDIFYGRYNDEYFLCLRISFSI